MKASTTNGSKNIKRQYYNGLAKVVNPNSVDEIGQGVRFFLDGNTFQPNLSKHIIDSYSDEKVAMNLEKAYTDILCRN